MDPLYRQDDIETLLTEAYIQRYRLFRPKTVALTGILFARPEDKLTKDLILPHLEFWHYRHDFFLDFFCAGYAEMKDASDAKSVGVTIRDEPWGFSVRAYVELIEHIQDQTSWKDNGDPFLLLANSHFDGIRAHLDFRRSMQINIKKAIEIQAASSPTEIATAIFEFAKSINEDTTDPIWDLSDEFGKGLITSSLMHALIAWLPSWLSPALRRGMQFVVHELPDKKPSSQPPSTPAPESDENGLIASEEDDKV